MNSQTTRALKEATRIKKKVMRAMVETVRMPAEIPPRIAPY